MRRREFIAAVGSVAAAGALAGCAPLRTRATAAFDLETWQAERRFAGTGFGRIAYVERGRGESALFLHGLPLNGFQWRGALERLSGQRRCIAPDLLGLGYTEVARGRGVGPDDQVAMLAAFLDRLGIARVDLVASDSGGAVAQLFVVRHRARVRSLLLANCDAEIDSPPPALLPVIELSKTGRFVDEWLAPWLADKALARSAKGLGGLCYADPAHPTDEALECYLAPLVRSPRAKARVHQYVIALERNPLAGVERQLRRSAVPARIVWGTADDIFSAESPGYLDRTFGNSRGVRRLAGRKLFWPEELPEVVAEEALGLWRAA
jgi:pimeloyl-ACP methyl ester carboxylesterase